MRIYIKNNQLSETHKELISEWDYSKNLLGPNNFTAGSNIGVWWICSNGHSWQCRIANRTYRNSKCPYCQNRKTNEKNCLASTHPKLIIEWHKSKNSITPFEITAGYKSKVWWECQICNYEWEAQVSYRTGRCIARASGCPNCAGKIANENNNLLKLHPELIKEWHIKNIINPVEILPLSKKKVWWIGLCGHEWIASIASRVQGTGCPRCNESKGEKKIRIYLENNKINYQHNYRFSKCRNKCPLPFDFLILVGNKIGLIEYQGIQHFKPIERFGGVKALKSNIMRDSIKEKFCLDNDIPLLKINYKKFNDIESLTKNFIKRVKYAY